MAVAEAECAFDQHSGGAGVVGADVRDRGAGVVASADRDERVLLGDQPGQLVRRDVGSRVSAGIRAVASLRLFSTSETVVWLTFASRATSRCVSRVALSGIV